MVTLVATNSRTAMIAVDCWRSSGRTAFRLRRLLLPASVAGLAMVNLLAFASATGTLPDFNELLGVASRSGHANEVLSLTGRTEIWSWVWEKIIKHPLLGYGVQCV